MSERATQYRARHPERVKASQRRWRERNRERCREYNREYKRRTQKDYRQRRKVELWNSIVRACRLIGGNDDEIHTA